MVGFMAPVILWLVLMLVVVGVLWVVLGPKRAASVGVRAVQGSVRSLVEQNAARMPGPGGGYMRPSAGAASTMAEAARQIEAGDLSAAAAAVRPYGYIVEQLTEMENDAKIIALRPEDPTTGRGWGTYLFAEQAALAATIEIPHPRADLWTEDLGAELFLHAGARWLLMAGTNRDAGPGADVAHESGSVFEAIHRATIGDSIVMQLHGFDGGTRSYGDAVVSSGTDHPGPFTEAAATALQGIGLRVCIHDGDHCTDLGGTTNVQGSSTREAQGTFLHVELSQPVRADAAMRTKVVGALTAILLPSGT